MTVYLMRLWRDGTVSVIWSGASADRALDFLHARGDRAYRGRQWVSLTPVVRPPPVDEKGEKG